ncbi:sigma 54-interacting transcriptional regulator [Peribacillus muralis]|uniref:sigma 54-interacting transcriptional regulator n=1 Tax=Peribacillus muralis TaxID=264697 RepID=UPI00070E0241|nr:sigma 54-interacting transcriptional regulator [Peribacillus muralis]
MLSIPDDKIRPFITITIDQPALSVQNILKIEEPFFFLMKENQVFAYIRMDDLPFNETITTADQLLQYAFSIDNVCKLTPNISLPLLFQIIGEPIVLIKTDEGLLTGYVKREDVLAELFKQDSKQNLDLLKVILTSIPMGIFVADKDRNIVNFNESGLKMIKKSAERVLNEPAVNIFNKQHIHSVFASGGSILNQLEITDVMSVLVDYSPILNHQKEVEGLIIIVQDLPMVEEMAMEIELIKSSNKDLNAILANIYDEILVVNQKGELLRYSDRIISGFWGKDLKDYIGTNLLQLEDEGIFNPSVTRLVLEQKKKVSIVQDTKMNKKVLSVGTPVFNEKGDIDRIVIASRDITETTQLKSELNEMRKELDSFKKQDQFYKELIFASPKMEQIISQVKKIAHFSSTVLINGESGVGKEVIAEAIHKMGRRSKQPFLKINCGAIPENLLESELFGYTKGSFTGADKNGKVGYFQQANKGVLFLDEVGDMPIQLQVKLLRVLQEQEVIPIGSTTPISIDVQIVAATNKSLEKMVEMGTFREDLFYRLNVIPIHVPPLRERPEDIPPLAFHFLQKLNERYHRNYHFSPDALNILEVYTWPGNIRELQNMIERLVVSADEEMIDADFIQRYIPVGSDFKQTKPIITRIIPLQEAQDHVEEQLIMLAMKQYKTTTKAAKALGISQSSVSRKYQKVLAEQNKRIENNAY